MLFLPSIITLRTTEKPYIQSVNCIKIFCKLGHVFPFESIQRSSEEGKCVWLTTHQKLSHKFSQVKIFMLTKCILPNMENITLFTETTKIPRNALPLLCVSLPVSPTVCTVFCLNLFVYFLFSVLITLCKYFGIRIRSSLVQTGNGVHHDLRLD